MRFCISRFVWALLGLALAETARADNLPSFTQQPPNQTVFGGQSTVFYVGAIGNPSPTFRWQRLPAGSATWADLANGGIYSGAGSNYLDISSTTVAMNGDQFRCVASNSAGSVNSDPGHLTVNPPVLPVITNLPTSLSLYTGDSFSFYPTVYGTSPITFQWNKDNTPISGAGYYWYNRYNLTTADAGQYTLTATNAAGSVTSAPVTVTVTYPPNIVRMVADRFRPRVYALQQNGVTTGSLVVLDPATAQPIATLDVGLRPTDCAQSDDGNELLVLCSATPSIALVNLQTLQITGTITLPTFGQWDVNSTTSHIKYGAGNVLYYTDGTWGPVMYVFNRSTQTVLQSLMLDGTLPNNNGSFGFGDFAVSPDKSSLFAWGQYGWTAGLAGSAIAKFTINANGTLSLAQTANLGYPGLARDPLGTPAFVSADGSKAFLKQFQFSTASVTNPTGSFPGPIYAISAKGEVAATSNAIYETATGNQLCTLGPGGTVQAITADYSRLVYFDSTARVVRSVDLSQAIAPVVFGLNFSPAKGAIVLPPSQLQWSAVAGATQYRVYLGTSSSGVAAATTASAEYLGQVGGTSISVPPALAPGVTYYWRVDAVGGAGVAPGAVLDFTVATIAPSVSAINAATVAGDQSLKVYVALTSLTPGKTWSATSSVPWITFANGSGVTPGILTVKFDASTAPVGLNSASVTVTTDDGAIVIPVQFLVDPLILTHMASGRGSTKVYAISEQNAAAYDGTARAYLLEIDTLFQRISRVTRVGTGVTDLVVHNGENRVYVTNWKISTVLAVDLGTFTVVRTYAIGPTAGYQSANAYRLAAGAPGRLMVESSTQGVTFSLLNTTSGLVVATSFQSPGAGAFDSTGRYYLHGDSGNSNAAFRKFDTAGDHLIEQGSLTAQGVTSYGSTTLVRSEDGHRMFWNGDVFNENLVPEWLTAVSIYSVSADGRYAFGSDTIYDVANKQAIGPMPVITPVSAFNSVTGQLVVQNGGALLFYSLPNAELPSLVTAPTNGAVVLPPSLLQWPLFQAPRAIGSILDSRSRRSNQPTRFHRNMWVRRMAQVGR